MNTDHAAPVEPQEPRKRYAAAERQCAVISDTERR